MPPKGHPSNVSKKLYKRLKNILEYNSFSTSVKKNSSFCKDITVMHILTKVRPFESHEQSLLFKFEDLQKSQFLYKDAFEYISTKRATYKMNKLCFFTLFVDKCCKKMSLSELYLSIKAVFF